MYGEKTGITYMAFNQLFSFRRLNKYLLIMAICVWYATAAHAFLICGTEGTIDSHSVVIGGQEFIPLLFVCEAFDVSYTWEALTNKVKLYKQGSLLTLMLNESMVDVNGSISQLKAPPHLHKGTLMVPTSILQLSWWQDKGIAIQRTLPIKKSDTFVIDKIIIDPGHGGKDSGANGSNGFTEKELVLDVSLKIKKKLERQGITVLLTRDRDYFVSLSNRAKMANDSDADLFISIHANGHHDKRANGFEIFYLSNNVDDNSRAIEMMENSVIRFEDCDNFPEKMNGDPTLWDMVLTENRRESCALAQCVNDVVKGEKLLSNRGVKSARFYVLKWVNKPSVLVELGFITNYQEQRKLNRPFYKEKLVKAIVKGILHYKKQYEKTRGFTV